MKEKLLLSSILIAVVFIFTPTQSFAETVASTTDDFSVSLNINKDDFLSFYGLTKDDNTNDKINNLRDDFNKKFQALKDSYQASLKEIVGDKVLTPAITLSSSVDTVKTNTAAKSAKALKSASTEVKKIIVNDSSTQDTLIAPISNVINQKAIYTENSSWFSKVKSFFNW